MKTEILAKFLQTILRTTSKPKVKVWSGLAWLGKKDVLGSCFSCLKSVGPSGVSAGGKTYHRECFRCHRCRAVLTLKFYMNENQPFCENCYKVSSELSDLTGDNDVLCNTRRRPVPPVLSVTKLLTEMESRLGPQAAQQRRSITLSV